MTRLRKDSKVRSCRVGAMETCASAPQVSSVARSRQKPLLDQMRQDSCAGGLLDVPQPPSLTLRETETGHLHELHPDARHELAINRNRNCQHRLVLTFLMRRLFPLNRAIRWFGRPGGR